MSPLRSFSAGIITTLLIVGSLAYWYLPHLWVVSDAPSSTLSGSPSSSPTSGDSSWSYVAQPFATPLSTDCSIYDPRQRVSCEADLANTIYTQFNILTPTEQLAYDCKRLHTEYQQEYCQNRKEAIPWEQQEAKILEKVRQEGISACSEFGSGSEQDQCQLDVALGRLVPLTSPTQSGTLAWTGHLARPTPPVPHCEILDGDLRVRCEWESQRMVSPERGMMPSPN